MNDFPPECPFTSLYLSSEDMSRKGEEELVQAELLEEEGRKQGVGHIPATADEVLQSDGDERWKWMKAGIVKPSLVTSRPPAQRGLVSRQDCYAQQVSAEAELSTRFEAQHKRQIHPLDRSAVSTLRKHVNCTQTCSAQSPKLQSRRLQT